MGAVSWAGGVAIIEPLAGGVAAMEPEAGGVAAMEPAGGVAAIEFIGGVAVMELVEASASLAAATSAAAAAFSEGLLQAESENASTEAVAKAEIVRKFMGCPFFQKHMSSPQPFTVL